MYYSGGQGTWGPIHMASHFTSSDEEEHMHRAEAEHIDSEAINMLAMGDNVLIWNAYARRTNK